MRIATAAIYQHITRDLQSLTSTMQQLNESLASGQKYQNIYQNPVATVTALGYNCDLSRISQYQSNLKTAANWLTHTDSVLQNIGNLIKTAKELASQMATGTINDDNRAAAVSQVEGLMAELLAEVNTSINGQYLFSGYKTDTAPYLQLDGLEIQKVVESLQPGSGYSGTATASGTYSGETATTYLVEIDAAGAVGTATFRVSEDGGQTWTTGFTTSPAATSIWSSEGDKGVEIAFSASGNLAVGDRFIIPVSEFKYQGDDHGLELGVGKNSRLAVNVTGRDALDGSSGRNDLFQILSRLKSALQNDDANGIGAALEALNSSEANLTTYFGFVGAQQERVIYQQDSYQSLQNNLDKSLSQVEDTDLIAATEQLNLQQITYQAALLVSTKIMALSLLDYL